jgi:hypothetical protein
VPSVTIRNDQRAYLERVAREASKKVGRRVSPTEALQGLLDLCIQDEAIYEPKTSSPMRAERRDLFVEKRSKRTRVLGLDEILSRVSSG